MRLSSWNGLPRDTEQSHQQMLDFTIGTWVSLETNSVSKQPKLELKLFLPLAEIKAHRKRLF